MLMIRMQRIGRRNDPSFRIVVLEKTSSPKAGTYTDLLGTYDPKTKAFTMAEDRLKDWMSKGAQLSDSLSNLLVKKGLVQGKMKAVISKANLEKNKPKEEPVAAPAPAAEAAPAAEVPATEEAASEAAVADAEVVEEAAPEAAPEIAAETAPEVVAEAPAEEAAA